MSYEPEKLTTLGAQTKAGVSFQTFGYLGATIVSIVSGWLIDNYGWTAAFNFWIASSFMAAVLLIPIWNKKLVK